MAPIIASQIVGNVGMFYAAYKLSRMGWNVMPTARNARGIDLLAYDTDATRYLGIQIKTLSRRSAVPLGNSPAKIMGDWWIIVSRVASDPVCFVLKAEDVNRLANKNGKDDRVSCWLEPSKYEVANYREAWDQIGRGDSSQLSQSVTSC